MGLQIWLPLNGNLENKGLGEISNIQGTPSYRANGKIGSALELSTKITISSSQLANLSTFTLCFWVNINSSTSLTTNWADIIGFNDISSTGTQGTFRCETCYNSTDWKGAHWHDNYVYAMLGSKISGTEIHTKNDDIWYHCVLVCNNKISKISFYTNGELTGEFVHNGGTINNTGTFYIGDTGNITGIINDIRIYDEALSPMQIKLISQGLVAHYLLNNNGSGNNNLALNSHNLNVTATKDNKNISNREPSVVQLREDGFYETKVTGRWGGISIYANSLNLQVGDKITFSFYIYINGSSKAVSFYPMMYNSSGARDTSSRVPISVDGGTYTTLNSKQIGQFDNTSPEKHYIVFEWNDAMKSILDNGGRIELSIQVSGTWQDGDYACLFAPKLEYGDKPTPWCPNSADSLATQLGYNNNIEYDVSGYCHNGTKYNITDYTSDTPRYSVATKFNGTNSYINVGRGGMVRDEITVNIWAYMEDWTKYNGRLISCTESGGWNFEKSSGGIHFAIGTGATSNSYKNTTNYPLADLTSGWHMFTGSYDGFQNKMYIDGVLAAQNNSPYTTKTPIYYNSSTPVLIGAEANKTQTPAGSYFDGYMSDVRIYATALSESDLQSLYNNSGFLDSSGNIYATEYTEL